MAEIILTSKEVDRRAAIDRLTPPASAVMFLEREPSAWLERDEVTSGIQLAAFDAQSNWSAWERGRIFCEAWELSWERKRTIYVGTSIELSDFHPGPNLPADPERICDSHFYLWGERDQDRFLELQVSRVLHYPLAHANRVRIRARQWFSESGEPIAARFLGLEAEP